MKAMNMKDNIQIPKTIFIFDNGNVAAFDANGEQMPAIQKKNIIELWFDFLSKQGIDVRKVEEIVININGMDKRIVPIKNKSGWSLHFQNIPDKI